MENPSASVRCCVCVCACVCVCDSMAFPTIFVFIYCLVACCEKYLALLFQTPAHNNPRRFAFEIKFLICLLSYSLAAKYSASHLCPNYSGLIRDLTFDLFYERYPEAVAYGNISSEKFSSAIKMMMPRSPQWRIDWVKETP